MLKKKNLIFISIYLLRWNSTNAACMRNEPNRQADMFTYQMSDEKGKEKTTRNKRKHQIMTILKKKNGFWLKKSV